MLIFKKYYFDSTHYMPGYDKKSKYGKFHGHSYEVTINVNGNLDKQKKWVMNFDELDNFVLPLIEILDHNVLNEIDGLDNPTSENIAKWFWKKLVKNIKFLESVEINRPRIGGCIYKGK